MKKILALALSMMMLFALCACGGETVVTTDDAATTTADAVATEEVADTTAEVVDDQPEKKTFRVAMECAYAPYNWAQETDANGAVAIADTNMFAYGYDVIIAKKIAEANNWDLEIVKLDWDSLIPALQSGTVDAVIAGQSITADRLEQVDFSTPYYYATIVTLVKNDSAYAAAQSVADLKGATGTSQLGTIWYDNCLGQIPEVNQLPAQETAPAMLVALNAGTCDVVVTDRPTGSAALAAYDNFVMLDFYGTDGDYEVSDEDINIGISVQKGNTELLDAINAVLAEMTATDYDELMNEAIAVQPLSE
ncbi:MAG: transporter substrate-binding domain-containing protein [Clostridia bacterium]|nr:transporter substrate-binding domain-containing protein [Clostridia bacterium]